MYEQNVNHMSVEDMWIFIDEILPKYGNIGDRDTMNYEQVFHLFSVVKESYHTFQIIAQTAILNNSMDKIQLLKNRILDN